MSIRGWLKKEITSPRGAWTNVSLVSKGHPARGNISQNMRFLLAGDAYSREGTSAVGPSASARVPSMYNWIAPDFNYLAYQTGSSVKLYNLATASSTTLGFSLISSIATFADLGPRLYIGGYLTDGTAIEFVHVTDESGNVDACFRGPLTYGAGSISPDFVSMAATDGGAGGSCTAGGHLVAFIFQARNGFGGQPSPIQLSGGVASFQPATVSIAAGHKITLNLTLNTPSDAGGSAVLIPIMTRADNTANWFILPPGALTISGNTGSYPAVPASTPGWVMPTVTISISDEDLASQTSALPNFACLTRGGNGYSPPILAPLANVLTYGKRMVYIAGTQVYASDINNPQFITADLNLISNPSQRNVKAGFQLGTELYLTADKWTGRVRDTGDSPSTWPPPSVISNAVGAPFQNCVCTSTGGTYAWIASEFGLYYFNGAYASRPITYYYGDQWKRINWTYAYQIQVAEDPTTNRVYVAAPLDAATACSHMFVIDYTRGNNPEDVDISLDNFAFGNFGSIEAVREAASNKTAIWIGPNAAGPFVHYDETTHQDYNSGVIHPIWESGYCREPGEHPSATIRLGAAHIWAQGSGTLLTTWYGLDRSLSVQPMLESAGAVAGQVPLTTAPGKEYYVKGDLNPVENYTMRFETNGLGDYFKLSGFRAYTKPSLSNR